MLCLMLCLPPEKKTFLFHPLGTNTKNMETCILHKLLQLFAFEVLTKQILIRWRAT